MPRYNSIKRGLSRSIQSLPARLWLWMRMLPSHFIPYQQLFGIPCPRPLKLFPFDKHFVRLRPQKLIRKYRVTRRQWTRIRLKCSEWRPCFSSIKLLHPSLCRTKYYQLVQLYIQQPNNSKVLSFGCKRRRPWVKSGQTMRHQY